MTRGVKKQAEEHLPPVTALVLAGRRGPEDAFAQSQGQSHKACIPLAGVPMIVRVLNSLHAATFVHHVVISMDDGSVLSNIDVGGNVDFHASQDSPASSVLDYYKARRDSDPVLVTTADHALLSTAMIEYFCAAAQQTAADVVVGVVSATLFRTHYPESRRTFLSLKNESLCGTNLFLLRTPQAINADPVLAASWAVSKTSMATGT